MQRSLPVSERPRRPDWMKVRAPSANSRYHEVKGLMREGQLVTICEEARCPNIGECWGRGTATFQILGDTCTRACRYCYVHSGKPEHAPDPLEPLRLAQAAAQMELSHVVVTSVDRESGGRGFSASILRVQSGRRPRHAVRASFDRRVVSDEALAFVRACQHAVPCHLGGGAALAGAFLGHRLSGDLDLFVHERDPMRSLVAALPEVARSVGAKDGLSNERAHAFKTLPKGALRGVGDALRGDAGGLGRASAIAAGLGYTAAGYLAGRRASRKER